MSEAVGNSQAALYRLSGDYNPLHIDPAVSKEVGFEKPILHGLCTFGISAKHVLQQFGGGDPNAFQSIKVRFVKHVYPGETITTEMWVEDANLVVFRTVVLERKVVAIANAGVVFRPGMLKQAGNTSKL